MVDVVADEDDRQPAHARLDDELQHHRRLMHAERRGRLVEDQHLGAEMHGARDGHRLALAARQRADGLGRVAHVDADVGHRLAGDGCWRAPCRCARRAGGSCVGSRPRKKLRVMLISGIMPRSWNTVATPSACASRGLRKRDRLAVDQDLALAGLVHAGQDLDQRRLAGAIVAEQAMHLAGIDLDVDVLQRADRAEIDADAAQFHGGVAVGMAGHPRRRQRLGPDVGVDQHGDQDDEAEEDLEPVGVDAGVEDAHLDEAEDQRPEQHAVDRAVAAGEQHAADDRRDDRLEFLEQAARRVGRARLHDLDGGQQAWPRRRCR